MDVGTAFGGIGSSREMMIASLAEPAMLLIVFTVALIAGTTQLSGHRRASSSTAPVGLRVSLGARAVRACLRGDRRERPHPDRQSGDASRTHHGARGDGAGIFRPPPRHDRGGGGSSSWCSISRCSSACSLPFGMATGRPERRRARRSGLAAYLGKLVRAGGAAADRRDRGRQDAGVPLSDLPRRRLRGRRRSPSSCCSCRGASDVHRSPSISPICSPAACWC